MAFLSQSFRSRGRVATPDFMVSVGRPAGLTEGKWLRVTRARAGRAVARPERDYVVLRGAAGHRRR
jgi:hypothetical protein